jgi:acetolactate synthase-1/2/3 large subunit
MHFVAALDSVPEMRAVLALFEGVATGAADGYGRMADRPAATLLHLGPGLGNGLANLHNARRARTPIVNIVGDHATYHQQYDAPLQSDILSVARTLSTWVGAPSVPADVAAAAADAVAAACAPPGGVATLVLPADVSWDEGAEPCAPRGRTSRHEADAGTVELVAKALRGAEPTALLVGGAATRARALVAASRVATATGAKLLCETFPARLERGAGIPAVERLGYLAEFTQAQLAGVRHLVLVDARAPVSFFAYPGTPSVLVPDDCEVHQLAGGTDDAALALEQLADALGAPPGGAALQPAARPERPSGALDGAAIAQALGALLPEGAIVSDEANTAGLWAPGATAGAPAHDWLTLTGGSIGQGLPVATGAAVACPDRPVIALEADGSAMYTAQALWTQAREGLDVTTIVYDNRSYAILALELSRVGVEAAGPRANDLFDLSHPPIDFARLAQSMGVPGSRATTAEELTDQLARAITEPGPHLIDAVIPARL